MSKNGTDEEDEYVDANADEHGYEDVDVDVFDKHYFYYLITK